MATSSWNNVSVTIIVNWLSLSWGLLRHRGVYIFLSHPHIVHWCHTMLFGDPFCSASTHNTFMHAENPVPSLIWCLRQMFVWELNPQIAKLQIEYTGHRDAKLRKLKYLKLLKYCGDEIKSATFIFQYINK